MLKGVLKLFPFSELWLVYKSNLLPPNLKVTSSNPVFSKKSFSFLSLPSFLPFLSLLPLVGWPSCAPIEPGGALYAHGGSRRSKKRR